MCVAWCLALLPFLFVFYCTYLHKVLQSKAQHVFPPKGKVIFGGELVLPLVKPNTFKMLLKHLLGEEYFYRLLCSTSTCTTFCVISVTFLHQSEGEADLWYCNIRGLCNWRRQKFSQKYLNYQYIILCSVPTLHCVLMFFGSVAD